MTRIAMLAGSRITLVPTDGAELILPPPPREPIADVGAAVRAALRYPLSGPPLDALAVRDGRATVVVDPRLLPLPGVQHDPRRDALAEVLNALARARMRTTILLAGGLERRAGARELEALLAPTGAREFRGSVSVHDCESESLRPLGAFRVAPELIEADLLVVVTAAETVLHGGAAALLGACGSESGRAATADSLLEPSTAPGWRLAVELERELARRVPAVGVSLALDHPRIGGRHAGYPHEPGAAERIGRSHGRRALNALPSSVRRRLLQSLGRQLSVTACFAGAPSVAHAEALLRGIALRGTTVATPFDALVVPLPWKSPHQPRTGLNAVTAAATGLGLALRLWRGAFPVTNGGTAVLLHRFPRDFGHGPQQVFRPLFQALQANDPERLAAAEQAAAADTRALAAYRSGRAAHPLLPFHDWESCAPALRRLGTVVAAGCRDAGAARALGFVPSHSTAQGVEMARGLAGPEGRVGLLLAPPYAPLLVGADP